jgi:hypothetical protein
MWLKIGTAVDACKCGKEPLGYMKCGKFLEKSGFSRKNMLHELFIYFTTLSIA